MKTNAHQATLNVTLMLPVATLLDLTNASANRDLLGMGGLV